MRLFNIIKPYKALILDEALLSTEFKIGFELEAICDNPNLRKDAILPSYHSGNTTLSGNVKKLFDMLNDKLGFGIGKIESDSSIRTYGFGSGAWGFEYGSPIIKFNPGNIDKICKFLKGLRDEKIFTNDSCGFHTHISFPGIDKESVAWVLFSIANDPELFKEVTVLEVNTEIVNFFGGYATKNYLEDLKALGDSMKESPLSTNRGTFSNEKYQVLRIHPQGTIEWRGPRGFLDSNRTIDYVEGYITKLYRLVLKIADIVTRKEYNGFDREEVHDRVKVEAEFNSEAQLKKDDKLKYQAKKIKDDPSLLAKMNMKSIEKIYDSDKNLFDAGVRRWLNRNMDSISTDRLKKIFDLIIANSNEYTTKDILNDIFHNYSRISPELSESILIALLEKPVGFGSSAFEKWIGQKLLDIRNPELLLRVYNIIMKGRNSTKNVKGYMPFFFANEAYLPLQFYSLIARENPELLYYFKRIPTKVQRTLTKRSPWTLQYINNPDPKVVDELKQKYGNEIDDYIMNEV